MTFFANVVRALIASPSDTADLRDAVERALHEWNGDRAAAASVILLPRRWETNAIPELTGEDGQSVINRQLVDDADVVIGIFHSRLGRETPRYASGTAEELDRAKNHGKRVHVYFSAMPIERDHADPQGLAALAEFKKEIEKLGLYGSFDTPASLKDQVKSAIEADIVALDLSAPTPSRAARHGAALRVDYARERDHFTNIEQVFEDGQRDRFRADTWRHAPARLHRLGDPATGRSSRSGRGGADQGRERDTRAACAVGWLCVRAEVGWAS